MDAASILVTIAKIEQEIVETKESIAAATGDERVALQQQLAALRQELAALRQERLLLLTNRITGPSSGGQGTGLYLDRIRNLPAPSRLSPRSLQTDAAGPLIGNWRPASSSPLVQLPNVAHPVFAELESMWDDRATTRTSTYKAAFGAALKLSAVGALYHEKEALLTDRVKSVLGSLVDVDGVQAVRSGFGDSIRPDWTLGDAKDDPSYVHLIMENKLDIGGSGDPSFQGAAYYAKFWAQHRESCAIFQHTVCPCLLLEVVGPLARLSSLSFQQQASCLPITPFINLLPTFPERMREVEQVARLLELVALGVQQIEEWRSRWQCPPQLPLAQTPRELGLLSLPHVILSDARYQPTSAVLVGRSTYRVALASTAAKAIVKTVAVKVVESYARPVHEAWAAQGLAPQILRAARLAGNGSWEVLEMEWLGEEDGWQPLDSMPEGDDYQQALEAAQQALRQAHAIKPPLVHGDARQNNVLVRRRPLSVSAAAAEATTGSRSSGGGSSTSSGGGGSSWEARFIDFEWAGEQGVARYPGCLNSEISWAEGVEQLAPLQQAHDAHILQQRAQTTGAGQRRPGLQARALPARRSNAGPPRLLLREAHAHAGRSWSCVGRAGMRRMLSL